MTVILKPDDIGKQMAELDRRLRILENTGRVTPAVVQQGWSVNTDTMRSMMSGAQTITGTAFSFTITYSLLNYDTIAAPGYDLSNSFNVTTHQFTVPITAYYYIAARVSGTNNSVAAQPHSQKLTMAFFKNGTEVSRGLDQRFFVTDNAGITQTIFGPFSAQHADRLPFTKGDVADVRLSNQNDGAPLADFTTDTTPSNVNYFVIALESA